MGILKTEVTSFTQLVVAKPSSGYMAETTVKSLAGKTQSDQILPDNSYLCLVLRVRPRTAVEGRSVGGWG